MPISPTKEPSWRAALHQKLDEVLDRRDELEAEAGIVEPEVNALAAAYLGPRHRSHAHLSTSPIGKKAQSIFRDAISIAADATGVALRSAALQVPANDGVGQRNALRHWLGLLEPVLDLPLPTILGGDGNECLAEHTVWLGLRALDVGEVWEIFRPGNRGNRPANLYSLSLARLSALQWKRRLLSLGNSEGDANRQITAVFGEQWDTIRKWQASCLATLGETFVASSLATADTDEKFMPKRTGFFGLKESMETRLQRAGDRYRQEKNRAAELSPAKKRAALRAEKQSA